jgi:hypothetical protein
MYQNESGSHLLAMLCRDMILLVEADGLALGNTMTVCSNRRRTGMVVLHPPAPSSVSEFHPCSEAALRLFLLLHFEYPTRLSKRDAPRMAQLVIVATHLRTLVALATTVPSRLAFIGVERLGPSQHVMFTEDFGCSFGTRIDVLVAGE